MNTVGVFRANVMYAIGNDGLGDTHQIWYVSKYKLYECSILIRLGYLVLVLGIP